jgi:pimeloyl-ACP methyl ester carboxylesterase
MSASPSNPRPIRERLELVGLNGMRLVADAAGDPADPPVLLLHGGGQTRNAWGTTVEALAGTGFRALTIDLRGHGESEWSPNGDYSIDAFAGDLLTIVRTFSQPPALVGASLGGITSLVAAGEHVSEGIVRAVVLVDVAPKIEEAGRNRIGDFMVEHMTTGFASLDEVADAIQRYNPHRPRPSDLAGLRKNLRERDGRWYWHWDPAFLSWRTGSQPDETRTSLAPEARLEDAARALDAIPTQLVRGRQSDLLSEAGAKAFLELVPHAEYVDVAGAGHMVAGDRNDLFNDAVVDFLTRTLPH